MPYLKSKRFLAAAQVSPSSEAHCFQIFVVPKACARNALLDMKELTKAETGSVQVWCTNKTP